MMPISEQTLKKFGFIKTFEVVESTWWEKDNIILVFLRSEIFFNHSDFSPMDEDEKERIREMVADMKRADKEAKKKKSKAD